MKKYILFFVGMVLFLTGCVEEKKFEVPKLTGRVVDTTNTLSEQDKKDIENAILNFEKNTGGQFAVCIVPEIPVETVETASIKVAEAWKIGNKEKDDGIIYLSIMNEFSSSYYMVNIEVVCVDINGGVLNTLNLNTSSYETIESLYPSGVQAKEYVIGDRVRSHSTTGGAYIYEVTTGGTTSSAKNLIEKTDYTVDGVVFKYVGVYPAQNTYGKQ
jgi:hypothetical protein